MALNLSAIKLGGLENTLPGFCAHGSSEQVVVMHLGLVRLGFGSDSARAGGFSAWLGLAREI